MNYKIIPTLILFIILASAANAVCTLTISDDTYLQGDTPLAEIVCDSVLEKLKDYNVEWANSTHSLENDTGTTPATISEYFYESYVIPLNYTGDNITATMTGTNLEGSDTFNVSAASTNDLLLSNPEFKSLLLVGGMVSVQFEVSSAIGNPLNNANCILRSRDAQNKPAGFAYNLISSNGVAGYTGIISPSIFSEGQEYSMEISCSCGSNNTGTECWDDKGNIIANAVGHISTSLTINTWLSVNTVTNKDEYVGREEMMICANLTNVDLSSRIPVEIYHQIRCSQGTDNDNDTDRALIFSDDNNPDERGIGTNTTQMQCKRFVVPEPKFLQGNTNECYASTSVWVISPTRTKIFNYVTTSNMFNITISDLNIDADWEQVNSYYVTTTINLSADKYSVYNGQGIGNIDLRLQKDYVESIRAEDQYVVHPLKIDNFMALENIKNTTTKYCNGSNIANHALEILDDGNIELEIRDVPINTSSCYKVWVGFQNYEERSVEALEESQKVNSLNSSTYYSKQNIISDSVVYTGLMQFNITILQEPANGATYQVTYNFYSRSGNGELVDTIITAVQGTGNKNIYLRTDKLQPLSFLETYLVTSTIAMQNTDGVLEYFPESDVGYITVEKQQEQTSTGQVGFYDVIVDTERHKYGANEIIVADITIINTGDLPDQDTELIYYLLDAQGNKYGEVKEQLLEVPAGTTKLEKEIALPEGVLIGEWTFNVEYYTVVQPKIHVYDTFQVIDNMNIINIKWEQLKEYYKEKPLVVLFSILGFVMLLWLIMAGTRKEKK